MIQREISQSYSINLSSQFKILLLLLFSASFKAPFRPLTIGFAILCSKFLIIFPSISRFWKILRIKLSLLIHFVFLFHSLLSIKVILKHLLIHHLSLLSSFFFLSLFLFFILFMSKAHLLIEGVFLTYLTNYVIFILCLLLLVLLKWIILEGFKVEWSILKYVLVFEVSLETAKSSDKV